MSVRDVVSPVKLKFNQSRTIASGCDHAVSEPYTRGGNTWMKCVRCKAVCFEMWMLHEDVMKQKPNA